jgi:hypothetical protein
LISKNSSNKYYLEDLESKVLINFDEIEKIGNGMITEGSFIIATGKYEEGNKTFLVKKFKQPKIESRKETLSTFTNINFFNNSNETKIINYSKYESIFEESSNMVILSDVYLDNSEVFEKITELFEGFKEDPPLLFVFIGSFIEKPYELISKTKYISCFAKLGTM